MESFWQESLQKLISSPKIDESSIVFPDMLDIVTIIESLQPFMTHSDPGIRGKAALIFKCAVFTKFNDIDFAGLDLLVQFMQQKVDDAAMVLESLEVLNFFYQKKILNQEEIISICIQALKNIKSFRFGVENRHGVFKFVKSFIMKTSSLSNDLFYESFLNAIENEKDPRNLMLIFDSINGISKFPLTADYIEEFFESIFCYFPITFRSNPSDPNLITVEELKGSLRRAISGDSRFGDLAVPLLIEKLSSNSSSAKIDSLDVLLDASNVYAPISFAQFRYQLEIALFSEIIANPEAKVQSKSLQLVRKLAQILSEEESENWMNKFLREAITAIELDSREIMSKSALLIEAVSSSSEKAFAYALNFCSNSLMKLSISEAFSVKGEAARNCLVALFSPLKQNPDWKCHFTNQQDSLNTLFSSVNCESVDSFRVYLVIFSFISSILSKNVVESFILKFLEAGKNSPISNELKNCIWLASKSLSSAFIDQMPYLENDQIISALASTPELTRAALIRLIQLNKITAIEDVIHKGDLSEVSKDSNLMECLLSSRSLDQISIIKLFSSCDASMQSVFISKTDKLEILLIGTRPEVIDRYSKEISQQVPHFTNPNTITSIYNKCPNLWNHMSLSSPELILSACKGLIYRMDSAGLNLLNENFDKFDASYFANLFSKNEPEIFSSSETFHTKKALHLQWLLNWLFNNSCSNSTNKLSLLISILSSAPKSLISLHSKVLPELVLNFLSSNDRELPKSSAWEVLVNILVDENIQIDLVDRLINLAVGHLTIQKEPQSIIRYSAMKLLCRLVEIPSTREECYKWQEKIILELKNFNDSKRSVRQEAARANNLWIVLKEEGIFQ